MPESNIIVNFLYRYVLEKFHQTWNDCYQLEACLEQYLSHLERNDDGIEPLTKSSKS